MAGAVSQYAALPRQTARRLVGRMDSASHMVICVSSVMIPFGPLGQPCIFPPWTLHPIRNPQSFDRAHDEVRNSKAAFPRPIASPIDLPVSARGTGRADSPQGLPRNAAATSEDPPEAEWIRHVLCGTNLRISLALMCEHMSCSSQRRRTGTPYRRNATLLLSINGLAHLLDAVRGKGHIPSHEVLQFLYRGKEFFFYPPPADS
jgi:hypothetical protein